MRVCGCVLVHGVGGGACMHACVFVREVVGLCIKNGKLYL